MGFWLLRQTRRAVLCGALLALLAANSTCIWRQPPICLREAQINSTSRIAFEENLAAELSKLPSDANILMFTGSHVGALQRAGIPLCRTINESNYGLWDSALVRPAGADYVVAMEGDQVADAVAKNPAGLRGVTHINVPGQPAAVLYQSEAGEKR